MSAQGRWVTCSPECALEAWWVPAAGGAVGRRGTVLMLQEIFGVNTAMREKAAEFAKQGFDVLVPDLYGRLERRVDLGYSEPERARGFQLMQQLDMDQALSDCAGAAAWARRQPGGNGKLAVVGFCLGGLLAVRFAAGNECEAVASFYGVRVDEHVDALRAIRVPVEYHVGDQDAHVPAERVARLQQASREIPQLQVFVHRGAKHGFFNRARGDVYDPAAAAAAGERVFALLKERLQ